MAETAPESSPPEDRVNGVIADYFRRLDAGDDVSPESLIDTHHEISDELREFFEAAEVIERLAGPTVGDLLSGACHDTARSRATSDTSVWRERLNRLPDNDRLELPAEIGKYRLEEVVGEGAMGTVYRAFDTELKRPVAMKIPKFWDDESDEIRGRFYREAQAAATLRHPHICPVFDASAVDCVHFIAMAYIDGEPLSTLLAKSKLDDSSDAEKAGMILKLATALHNAHDHGIIHRDVKPGNIIIDEEGQPILTDFGLARDFRHDDARLSHPDAIIGSPAYMAPEQLNPDRGDVGPATDIYGLGVVFYEMLTGQPPYLGSTYEVLTQVALSEPKSPKQSGLDIDPQFDAICRKMMQKQIDQRYGAMSDVIDAIELALQSPRQDLDSPKHVELPKRGLLGFSSRAIAATSLAVFAMVFLSVVLIIRTGRSSATIEISDPRVTVTIGQDVVQGNKAAQRIQLAAGGHKLIVEGDGLHFETKLNVPAGKNLHVKTKFVDGNLVIECDDQVLGVVQPESPVDLMPHELRRFVIEAGPVRSVSLARDGQSFLCGADDGSIRLYRIDRDKPVTSIAGHEGQINCVQFSPDGKHALSGGKDRAIRLWNLSTGKLNRHFTGNLDKVRCLRFFQDGRRFVSGGNDAQIRFWDIRQATPVATCGYRDDQPIPRLQVKEDLAQLKAHVTWIRSIDLHPDESHLVSGGNEGLIAIWDVNARNIVRRLIGHLAPVSSVAYSHDGNRILSGGFDNTLRLWDADTGELLQTHDDHSAPVRCAAFSDDDQLAYSVSIDGTVRTWDLARRESSLPPTKDIRARFTRLMSIRLRSAYFPPVRTGPSAFWRDGKRRIVDDPRVASDENQSFRVRATSRGAHASCDALRIESRPASPIRLANALSLIIRHVSRANAARSHGCTRYPF